MCAQNEMNRQQSGDERSLARRHRRSNKCSNLVARIQISFATVHVLITCCSTDYINSESIFISTSALWWWFFYYSLADSFSSIFKGVHSPSRLSPLFLLMFWFFPLSQLAHLSLSAESYISLYKFVLLCILCKQAFCIDKCKSHTHTKQRKCYTEVRKKVMADFCLKIQRYYSSHISFRPFCNAITYRQRKTPKLSQCKNYLFVSVLCATRCSLLAARFFQWFVFEQEFFLNFEIFCVAWNQKKKFVQNEVHGNTFWNILIRIKLNRHDSNHSFNGKNVFLYEWKETEAFNRSKVQRETNRMFFENKTIDPVVFMARANDLMYRGCCAASHFTCDEFNYTFHNERIYRPLFY